jgi:tRNA threonylcarbamoyladenosine biosynthesis protein TsaE
MVEMTSNRVEITLHDERDTDRLGAALAAALPSGTVIGLVGTLGAGKTRLVQAVAAALGAPREAITSPTFVLVNEYRQGRVPVFHFDTYRLKDDDEFLELGPEEYFESDGLTFVEWADRVEHLLPEERVEITLEVTGDTERRVTIVGTSPLLQQKLDQLAAVFTAK